MSIRLISAIVFVVSFAMPVQSATKLEIAAQVLFAPQCTIGWLLDKIKKPDRSKDANNQKNCWWNKESKK